MTSSSQTILWSGMALPSYLEASAVILNGFECAIRIFRQTNVWTLRVGWQLELKSCVFKTKNKLSEVVDLQLELPQYVLGDFEVPHGAFAEVLTNKLGLKQDHHRPPPRPPRPLPRPPPRPM